MNDNASRKDLMSEKALAERKKQLRWDGVMKAYFKVLPAQKPSRLAEQRKPAQQDKRRRAQSYEQRGAPGALRPSAQALPGPEHPRTGAGKASPEDDKLPRKARRALGVNQERVELHKLENRRKTYLMLALLNIVSTVLETSAIRNSHFSHMNNALLQQI